VSHSGASKNPDQDRAPVEIGLVRTGEAARMSIGLGHAGLRYADLRYGNLRYGNLRHADLRYGNLR
jgi:uncharacterized protein YjbI with pentapeptide repeats